MPAAAVVASLAGSAAHQYACDADADGKAADDEGGNDEGASVPRQAGPSHVAVTKAQPRPRPQRKGSRCRLRSSLPPLPLLVLLLPPLPLPPLPLPPLPLPPLIPLLLPLLPPLSTLLQGPCPSSRERSRRPEPAWAEAAAGGRRPRSGAGTGSRRAGRSP